MQKNTNTRSPHHPPAPAPKPCITQTTGAAKEKIIPTSWNPVTMSLPSKPREVFITPGRQEREAACQCIRGSLGWEVTWHLLRGLQLSSCHTGLPPLSSAASQLRTQEGKAILKHNYLLFPAIPCKSLEAALLKWSSTSLHSVNWNYVTP